MTKKICFCTTTSITLKTFVLPIAEMLNETGDFEVSFICAKDNDFEQRLPDYIKFIPIDMKRGIDFSAIKTIILFYKIFKQYKFDIVQYSTPNASLYASIASKISKVPIRLYAQWGIRYVGFKGIKRKIFKLLEKIVCLNSTDIRAVSKMNMEFGINEKLYKKDKVKLIGIGGTIGVSLSKFDIDKKEISRKVIREKYKLDDKFVFGFVGRFSRDKGSNELLEAIKILPENVCLLCVGSDEVDNSVNKDLFEWAKKTDKVIFTGFIEHEELYKYYSAMDCFVHPTYREGFGMVLQEAGAMGLPIITTKIPGASEVMVENESCILSESKNANDLISCMKQVMNNNLLKSALSINALQRVKKYFERKKMIEFLLYDYRQFLERED